MVAVADPVRIGGKLRITQQFFAASKLTEPFKLLVVVCGHDDKAVGGLEGLVGHGVWMRCAEPLWHLSVGQVIEALVVEPGYLNVQKSEVDILAFAVGIPMPERR